jgi:uncharacterized membrane protein
MNTMTIEANPGTVRTMHIIYALHTLGLVAGAIGAATTVVGSFLGLPSVAAVVVSYIYRNDAKGTWLESHFTWTLRTFWWVLGWAVVIGLVSLPLAIVLIGIATWVIGIFVLGIWAIYRIARGWLRLNDKQAMPA